MDITMNNLLKKTKTPAAFAKTHKGSSITGLPGDVIASQNMQQAKVAEALTVILKTAGIAIKLKGNK